MPSFHARRHPPCSAIAAAALALAALAAAPAHATVLPNPDPSTWTDDLGGTGLFTVPDFNTATERLDIAGSVGGNGEFGFYFLGTDPTVAANRIPIFTAADQSAPGDPPQQAYISFSQGLIIDVDTSANSRTFVNPVPSGDPIVIGFYLRVFLGGSLLFTDFTQPGLNAGGVDRSGTHQKLSDPTDYLLTFFNLQGQPIAFEEFNTLTPYVPEPPSLLLLGAGLVGLAGRRARRR